MEGPEKKEERSEVRKLQDTVSMKDGVTSYWVGGGHEDEKSFIIRQLW